MTFFVQIEDLLLESMDKQIEDEYEFPVPDNQTGVVEHTAINLAWDRVQHQVQLCIQYRKRVQPSRFWSVRPGKMLNVRLQVTKITIESMFQ